MCYLWNNSLILFVCTIETPHCADKNGAEGAPFIHPAANVLDPLWPKGNLRLLFLLKRHQNVLAEETKLCFSVKGFKVDSTSNHHEWGLCKFGDQKPTVDIYIFDMFSCSNDIFVSAGSTCYPAWSDAGQLEFYHLSLDWNYVLYLRGEKIKSLCNLCFWKTFNPILILTLVPIMDSVIYPLIKKCGLNFT